MCLFFYNDVTQLPRASRDRRNFFLPPLVRVEVSDVPTNLIPLANDATARGQVAKKKREGGGK